MCNQSKLIAEEVKEGNCCIVLQNIDTETMHDLLRYMYTGYVEVRESHLRRFLQAARFLKITSLMKNLSDELVNETSNHTEEKNSCDSEDRDMIESDDRSQKFDTSEEGKVSGTSKLTISELESRNVTVCDEQKRPVNGKSDLQNQSEFHPEDDWKKDIKDMLCLLKSGGIPQKSVSTEENNNMLLTKKDVCEQPIDNVPTLLDNLRGLGTSVTSSTNVSLLNVPVSLLSNKSISVCIRSEDKCMDNGKEVTSSHTLPRDEDVVCLETKPTSVRRNLLQSLEFTKHKAVKTPSKAQSHNTTPSNLFTRKNVGSGSPFVNNKLSECSTKKALSPAVPNLVTNPQTQRIGRETQRGRGRPPQTSVGYSKHPSHPWRIQPRTSHPLQRPFARSPDLKNLNHTSFIQPQLNPLRSETTRSHCVGSETRSAGGSHLDKEVIDNGSEGSCLRIVQVGSLNPVEKSTGTQIELPQFRGTLIGDNSVLLKTPSPNYSSVSTCTQYTQVSNTLPCLSSPFSIENTTISSYIIRNGEEKATQETLTVTGHRSPSDASKYGKDIVSTISCVATPVTSTPKATSHETQPESFDVFYEQPIELGETSLVIEVPSDLVNMDSTSKHVIDFHPKVVLDFVEEKEMDSASKGVTDFQCASDPPDINTRESDEDSLPNLVDFEGFQKKRLCVNLSKLESTDLTVSMFFP